jgi:hypothetical protein
MGFSQKLKQSIRKRAHFACCLCFSKNVEIHHILPKEQGGPDIEDNAAPLCPSCHELYGSNPTKRTLVREARDAWYEICDKRFVEYSILHKIESRIQNIESYLIHSGDTLNNLHNNNSKANEVTWKSLEKILSYLYARDFAEIGASEESHSMVDSLLGIFLMLKFWTEEEDRRNRRNFLRRFGTFTASRVLLQILFERRIRLGTGISAPVFLSVLDQFQTIIMLLLHEESLVPELHIQLGFNNNQVLLARLADTTAEKKILNR